jgi:phosphoribosylglycinamide formyltransferase-1
VNIMALVSGGGTNLQALLDAEKSGGLGPGTITLVVSDHPGIYALERARAVGVPTFTATLDKNTNREERRQALSDYILQLAEAHHIDLIVYAGFLWILKGAIIETFAGRMINLHPALLPKYGGKGMYGEHVHKAVLAAGEKESVVLSIWSMPEPTPAPYCYSVKFRYCPTTPRKPLPNGFTPKNISPL